MNQTLENRLIIPFGTPVSHDEALSMLKYINNEIKGWISYTEEKKGIIQDGVVSPGSTKLAGMIRGENPEGVIPFTYQTSSLASTDELGTYEAIRFDCVPDREYEEYSPFEKVIIDTLHQLIPRYLESRSQEPKTQ